MFQIISILVICYFTFGQSYTFPVFGTKRYHRASNNVGFIPSSSSSSSQISSSQPLVSTNPIVPYYNSIPSQSQYYDEQPIYALPPNYQYISTSSDGHLNNNNDDDDEYYYPSSSSSLTYTKPRHEYNSYGMPTYHGEYKPSPYYYAPGPSYSYYDDREISNNPLDDLHEEILQEDERERQRELYPVIGQENWYGNSRKQDVYTKNFLRNLIAYNRQMEAQQQEQQQQQQQQQQFEREQENDYDDYMEMNPSEYEYEQINQNPYELLQDRYEKQQIIKNNENNNNNDADEDMEDENVRQLKLLANSKQSKKQQQEKQKQNKSRKNNQNNNNKKLNNKNLNYQENIKDNYHHNNHYQKQQEESFSNWQKPTSDHISTFNQYDLEEPNYDGDMEESDWINWERKRTDNQMMLKFPQNNNDESIIAFSNRKPSLIISTKKPLPTIKSLEPSSSLSPSTTTTTTTTSTSTTLKPTFHGKFPGQKEFVLPRPATPVKHLFPQPVLDMIDKGIELAEKHQKQQQQQQTMMDTYQQTQNNEIVGIQKQNAITSEDSTANDIQTKRSKDSNIYDTIKELIAMEEQLEKNSATSKLQKRFVLNEEHLVHELDNLKRRSL